MQSGSALGKTIFDEVGPAGTVALRTAFAAAVLMLLWRPAVRGHSRADYKLVLVFGAVLGLMNLSFYESLDRIPLGVAVTLEFVGPLGVAVAGSRRALDIVWVVLAAAGIVLLARGGGDIDPVGVVLALTAGALWAAYILLSVRAGRAFPGVSGLALAMVVGAVIVAPFGIAQGGTDLFIPMVLVAAFGVAMMSSVIPYSLELTALRRLSPRVFGILMSLEPATAALAGWVILDEDLLGRQWLAIVLVAAASAGASLTARQEVPIDA